MRRKFAAIGGAFVSALTLVVVASSSVPAYAASEWPGTPEPSGAYAHCNFSHNLTTASSSGESAVSCQYGMNDNNGTVRPAATVISMTIVINRTSVGSGCTFGGTGVQTFSGSLWITNAIVNGGGTFQSMWVSPRPTTCVPSSGTLAYSVTSCSITISQGVNGGSAGSCTLDTATTVAANPSVPTKTYPGGESAGSIPSPCFTWSPASPAANAAVAFDGACSKNASEQAGSVYAWTFTTGTATDAAGIHGSSTWVANGSYTVTLTITKSAVAYTYSQTVVIGAGGDSAECPTGWGLLNPSALITGLQCLFVPTVDIPDRFGSTYTTLITKWPVAPVTWATGMVTAPIFDINDYLLFGDDHCDTDEACTLSVDLPCPPTVTCAGGVFMHVDLWSGSPTNPTFEHLAVAKTFTLWFSRLSIIWLVIYGTKRLMAFVQSGGAADGGGDGEGK